MAVLYAIVFLLVATAAIAGASAAPWLPTRRKERERIAEALHLNGDEAVVDLGCGDGAMLFAIAERHPNAVCIGYDISLLPLCIGWIRRLYSGHRNVSLRFGNLFSRSIKDADVVFVFLLSKAYPRLKAKFANELRDDARVVVEAWPLPDVEPVAVVKETGVLPVYIYEGKAMKK